MKQDSSVINVIQLWMSEDRFPAEVGTFFVTLTRPTLGTTKTPIEFLPWTLSLWE